jgi:predicted nuclease with TOPRIM domain
MSERQLKQQVRELVAVNEALSEKLAAFVADHEATVTELSDSLADVKSDAARYKEMWEREYARTKDAEERAKRYEAERDIARRDYVTAQTAATDMQAQRDKARGHAEAMRNQAYPTAPKFDWDPAEPRGNYDPFTGAWRGN